MRRLLFNNANQINTIIIGFNDGDMQWPYINHIANTGNVTICRDHEARDRRDIIVIGKVLNIKRLLQGMQICTAFYQPAVTVGNDFRRFVSVRECNLTAISWIHVSSLFLQAMRVAIPAVIVALSVGTSEVQNMLNAIPEVVTNGLNIAGGMIVVVGYAMVINMMRAGYLMPFFYLGFVTAAFTNFNLVALGVIGTVMAVLYIQLSPKYNRVAGAPAQAAGNNDLDNELD